MKNIILVTFLSFITISTSSCDNLDKESKVKLVLTGSVHGQLDPCGWKKNPLGGLSRKYIAIENMRKKGYNPLILDAGDMFFSKTNIAGSIKAEKFRCSTMLKGYEKIGCDALNIGKYELLAGVSFLKEMENKYKSIPFISANIKYRNTGELMFRPYVIEERDGLKLGIIGLSNMVPDTMTNLLVDDYIEAGNKIIKNLRNKVDLIILLVNTDRNSQSSLAKTFDDADFVFTSGSTHRTSASMPQLPEGPYVYANGKQGKYLTVIDLDIKNSKDPIADLSSKEQKVRQLTNRLQRLQKKDPSKKLEDIYSGQDNILNLIKRYRSELETAKTLVEKAKNKMRFSSLALNKKINDDPEILAMVDVALNKFKILGVDKNSTSVDKHHNHNHSRSLKKKDSRKSKKIKSKP